MAIDDATTVRVRRSRVEGTSLAAFRHRDFALFWWTALISNSASWMQLVAVPKLLYDLTHSTTWLGVASFASMGPNIVITPFAGVLADRVPRRVILIVTQFVMMVIAMVMWAMWRAHALTPNWILILLLVNGVAAGFQTSAWQSFVPTLVPPTELLDAVRMNSVQFTASRGIGPGLGALLLDRLGVGVAFLANAGTYLFVIGALVVVSTRQVITSRRGDPVLPALAEGFRYVRERAPLRHIVTFTLLTAFCGQSMMSLAAGISVRVYDRTSQGNAALVAALGAGSIVMSIFVIGWAGRVRRSHVVQGAFVLYVAAVALLGATRSFPIGMVAFFLVGAAHIPVAVSMNTYLQGFVEDERRGRVLSVYLLAVLTGTPLGGLVLGRLGDIYTMRAVLLGNAVVFGAAVVYGMIRFGGFRELDVPPAGHVDASTAPDDRPARSS